MKGPSDAKKNEAELLELTRETSLNAMVEALRSIHKAKQVAGVAREPAREAPCAAAAPEPSLAPPRALPGDFLGDLARLGLNQINDALVFHGRYADDVARWFTERLLPRPKQRRPDSELMNLRGAPGAEVGFQFRVRNETAHRAKVDCDPPVFRSADNRITLRPTVTFEPPSLELDPDQDWIVAATITLADGPGGAPFTPGRYVGTVDVRIGDRVAHALLIGLDVESARGGHHGSRW